MGKIIGIDLGTTNSVVSVWEGGQAQVINNLEGARITPSVVGFSENGQKLVGAIAKRQAITNPARTIFSIKRFMGRRKKEVTEEEHMVPYKISSGKEDRVVVEIDDKKYTPPEISAMILEYLKEAAESYLGEKVKEAVITVPAYFNDSQRQATKDAGKIAGLNVRRIINEPTAAALAYGLEKEKNEKIAVYDFGGGTFDISILEVGDNVVEVLSTNGDTHLGGDNIDQVLINYVADEFKKENGINLLDDQMALQRLKDACEKAKCELSSSVETEINLPFITADASGAKHLLVKISRAKFETLIEDIINKTIAPCKQAIQDAKLDSSELDQIILVGGSTRIPLVQQKVEKFFGKKLNRSVNPDEVVAVGAAIQGAVLAEDIKDILLLDVTPLSLGLETLGGVFTKLIERNTAIPTSKKEIFSTAADNQTSVEIHILQGEREMATNNRSLGRFILDGIPAAPRGVPQIEVAFDIDANGILSVSAKDLATGKQQAIEIKASSGLAEKEIEDMVQDAEKNREEDKKQKELIVTINSAEQLIYATEKSMKDLGDKISSTEKDKVEEGIKTLKKTIEEKNIDKIKNAVEELTKASHTVTQKVYEEAKQNTGKSEPQASPGEENPNTKEKPDDDNIIDAEFETKE